MDKYTVEEYKGSPKREKCPICGGMGYARYLAVTKDESITTPGLGGGVYYTCERCGSIFLEPNILKQLDNGYMLVEYSDDYWVMEQISAAERCYGAGLARVAEAVYYCQIPINNFLDIGTGTGKLLDAVSLYLPSQKHRFWGVEKYPPKKGERTASPNYIIGSYSKVPGIKFECGTCIEVVEHLTPKMLKELFSEVAKVSTPGALYLINSGFASFIECEGECKYLDPFIRGHIVSYSLEGLRYLLEPLSFNVFPVKGKNWLVAIEYKRGFAKEDITERIWKALPENLEILTDPVMGSVMKLLGLESVRAYLIYQ